MTLGAAIAANRFGLGARPGELKAIGGDPRGWLKAQLAPEHALSAPIAARSGAAARLAALPPAMDSEENRKNIVAALLASAKDNYPMDAAARLQAAVTSETALVERLAAFWSNHFTVSAVRPLAAGMIGPFEAEAIRPNLFGRFVDLLKATTFHPAMLFYLDNATSIGPHSKVGRKRNRGLNENLARELMELHTIGVGGGYTQQDVTELAKILTGWTIRRPNLVPRAIAASRGSAVFLNYIHEPGEKTVLGKTYREAGPDEADRALDDLADHPTTATFIAGKLARHFIADRPPAEAVTALAETFRRTGGDLTAVYRRLVDLDAAWSGEGKYRSPHDWTIAAFRAFGATDPIRIARALPAMKLLGQRLWFAPSPAGWPDDAASWLAPESLLARIDYAESVGKARADSDPLQLADCAVGDVLGAESRFAIDHAPSRAEAVALLLVSPEFLRR